MPPIFKALASINAWTFFIVGWLMALITLVVGITNGDLLSNEPAPMLYAAGFAVALAYGLGSIVVMVLRKKME
jgi:hypothetical protein